jgi:rRNA maturation endonuclease Nob1
MKKNVRRLKNISTKKSKSRCRKCGRPYPLARALLGYDVCTLCGERLANKLKEERKERVAVLYNKGGYQYINSPDDIDTIGKK